MIENRHLLFPYAAPYFVYVVIASLLGDVISNELNYVLRMVAATGLLIWAWRWYIPLRSSNSLVSLLVSGFLYGLIGCLLWVALLTPFTSPTDAKQWSTIGFTLRLLSAGLLVPVFEELMVRGFAFRLALQWDQCRRQAVSAPLQVAVHERSINDVSPGEWSWPAVIISTLVFMIGHSFAEWPAAVAYGLLMAFLLIRQKDILACIIAHGVTNITLAAYIYLTDSRHLW